MEGRREPVEGRVGSGVGVWKEMQIKRSEIINKITPQQKAKLEQGYILRKVEPTLLKDTVSESKIPL